MAFFYLFVPSIALLLVLLQAVKLVRAHERGVLFRLGKLVGVVGPGVVIVIPAIDRLTKVDLNMSVPSWQALSEEELRARVQEFVVGETNQTLANR